MDEKLPNHEPMGVVLARWAAAPRLRLRLSIRDKILLALLMVVILMSVPYIFLIVPGLEYKTQYDVLIQNITTANSINGYIKPSIDAELWEIIAGKKPFAQGTQYAILNDIDHRIELMIDNSSSQKGRVKLGIIQHTLQTLRRLIDKVGIQIAQAKTFAENLVLMEEIRSITQLIEGNVQAYALFEVNRTQQQYQAMQSDLTRWAIGGIGVIMASILFSIVAAWRISKGIYIPIKKLHDVTTTIARQDLEGLVMADNADEITELGLSFNIMVGKIKELLDAKLEEHENLKKAELRVLQAQINPHFLYNTLDAIIWMAEAKRTAQIIDLVSALSRFFRITLSKGRDWISVPDEIAHIESYLAIQKIRYRDILDYQIDIPEDTQSTEMLKLTLQPLVENALYHGIKNKRSGGTIVVRGRWLDGDRLRIEVEDNGIGMTQERLQQVRTLLEAGNLWVTGVMPIVEDGYGISNVNQRIKLYYGSDYGLSIESEHGRGTCVALIIPRYRGITTQPPLALAAR
ncbi:MAG TPA: sensor histidine kinase [Herpetosiphon sp.]|uniref:histidine kinase n=1 Tax=Herpetosiphon aurantiacus (strain ATCC 23779 / DSM 785 / 114-95) TaxID=316274 RepID=A9AWB2_HERA2|nr:sensor histidine kinase [Herpetosiphon sp.]ABX04762.1 histidine kinase internal region [Herpetosiphon aurantiacus DSM 785]HBW49986.1 sensor histidine kinase [Herpetosiphon sp.]